VRTPITLPSLAGVGFPTEFHRSATGHPANPERFALNQRPLGLHLRAVIHDGPARIRDRQVKAVLGDQPRDTAPAAPDTLVARDVRNGSARSMI
jgi:hypothetical protein